MGPLLFLIYINDLAKTRRNCKTFLYADDRVVVATGSITHNVYETMQTDLNKLSEWCVGNKLTVNIKTKAMLLGTRHNIKRFMYQPLTWTTFRLYVTSYKYLGVTLDSTLNFNKQINNVIQSAAHQIYMLSKICSYSHWSVISLHPSLKQQAISFIQSYISLSVNQSISEDWESWILH